jgi:LysM repeat protein
MVMLFGCAGTKETVSQKYAASKSWLKEKWQGVGSKSSSSENEETSVEPERTNYFEHQVKWSGETLSLIARWYTGSYGNWKAIAEVNPGLDPNRIAVGDSINIPPEMMKTKKPLPRKVVCKTLPGYFAHTVTQEDEKFSAIARWYTGNAENWKAIAEVNPDIDPDFLLVGNEIYIPSSLLKTRKPMVARSNQISAAKPAEKQPATEAETKSSVAAKPEKIQLFGPKQ